MDLDAIKQKKLEELQSQQQEIAQMQQQVAELETLIRPRMDKDALARYGTLKMAHPEIAVKALVVIAQHVHTGQLATIDDKTLKRILIQLQPHKRDIKITRR